MDTNPSKSSLVKGLKAFAEDIDGVPTIREMRKNGPYSPYYYKHEFGSWHGALKEAEIEPTHGVRPDVGREELIEDLQRTNDITENPPRRRDVDEHGEYDYIVYNKEFESFIQALEESGIEPDEEQYRFSSVETPPEKRGSANVEKLRNNGPTPITEMPSGISIKDRQNGIWKFRIDSGSVTPSNMVCYLQEDHAPELVIRRFFQHNPHVLEYRYPHGIKIDIRNHQSHWKEIGNEIVDEMTESGVSPTYEFENLVLVSTDGNSTLQYCFEQSIDNPVSPSDIPYDSPNHTDVLPIWGFSSDEEAVWNCLSKLDGVLFSTDGKVYTHYVPVMETFKDRDLMIDLWVEYKDGVRSGGIDQPWPYLVLGGQVQDITISREELAEELETDLAGDNIQLLDTTALRPFLNKYSGFESFLRNRDVPDRRPPALEPPETTEEMTELLLQVPLEELISQSTERFESVDRRIRDDAFRQGIYDIYPRCAICDTVIESPEGGTNIEAAHILPKAEGGPDVLQNGLGLCSRHHWAFDQGWFEITLDHEIQVRDFPELEGSERLKKYDGESLILPSDTKLRPESKYIEMRYRS